MVAPTKIKRILLDGKDTIKIQCPTCYTWGIVDNDMLFGKVSMNCPLCIYHETHDISYLLKTVYITQ